MASLLRMSVVNTSAGMMSMLAGFICSIIVARVLGVEGTGIVAYALWFMTVSTIVSDYGMPQAALRFIARDASASQRRSALFRKLFSWFRITSALMALSIAGYAAWLWSQGNTEGSLVWFTTILLFLTYAYSTMGIGAAQGLGLFDRAAQMTFIGALVQPFCVLAGALVLGPVGAILGHTIRHLPQALDMKRYLATDKPQTSSIPDDVKKYARNNWYSGSVLALFGSRIELAIIGFFFSIVQVGYYSIGLTMTGMVAQLSLFIVAFVVPQFGAMHDQNDHAAFSDAFERTLRWLAIIIAPISIGGASIAPELIPLVFGDDFMPAVWPAIILLSFSFAHALAAVISRAILAKNRSGDELRITIAWSGLSVLMLLAMVPFFGQEGAAWTRGSANLLLLIVLGTYCHFKLDLKLPLLSLAKTVVAGGACAGASIFTLSLVSGIPGLLLAVTAAAIVYFLVLALLCTVPRSDIEPVVAGIRAKLKSGPVP